MEHWRRGAFDGLDGPLDPQAGSDRHHHHHLGVRGGQQRLFGFWLPLSASFLDPRPTFFFFFFFSFVNFFFFS
jgi:hypothetical protein